MIPFRWHWGVVVVCIQGAFLATTAHAWPGFDWNTWREISAADAPVIDAPQAGDAALRPLLPNANGAEAKVDWIERREAIVGALTELIGTPTNIQQDETPARAGEPVEEEGYTRTHLWIPGEVGDPISAYILHPTAPIATPTPVMIVLHQTQAAGKEEACGLSGDPELAFAVELARRGYVCIVPDAIGFGERTPENAPPYHGAHDFYTRHPNWSYFGKMNWDIGRVCDYIAQQPGLAHDRVGVIGHSHGAYGSIMAAAFEPRIALIVASCGFTTLRTDSNPERWSHLTALLPRLGFYLEDIAEAPFDWHEAIALLAPRPFFNWATREDSIFPGTDNLEDVYAQVRQVYALSGASQHFEGRLAPGEHRFPPSARADAYEWIGTHLAPSGGHVP